MSKRIDACVAALRALDEAIAGEIKPIPEGWFSRQMLEDSGMSRANASKKIAQMNKHGIVESQKWRIASGSIPIYRVKVKQ